MTQWAAMNGQSVLLLFGFILTSFTGMLAKFLFYNIRGKLIEQDFQPDLVTIIWPDNRELQLEEVTYIPNRYILV